MQITDLEKIPAKDLIVFDLDGTLARTKSPADAEMLQLFNDLLRVKKVAVIGGGKYEVFQMQLLDLLHDQELLKNLFIFPTTATAFYRYDNDWRQIYKIDLTAEEIKQIHAAFETAFKQIDYKHPEKTYGDIIENRGSQVSFSVYGQDVVKALGEQGIKLKEEWKEKNTPVKMKIAELVQKQLPNLEVRAAGFTTIDVTKKGIDKAYGIKQIQDHLNIPVEKMLFAGDAIVEGGNDYAVVKTGIDYVAVKDPEDTKKLIRKLI
jgi:phosphomannomutase